MSAAELDAQDQSSGRWLTLLFLLLVLGTLALAQTRFSFGNESLLPNLDFQSGLAGWEVRPAESAVSAANGVLSLAQPDHSQFIVVWQALPEVQRFRYLRLSAEMKTDGVVQGELFWQKARIVLVGRDADGKAMIRRDHVLTARDGSGAWIARQAVFEVLPGMAAMQLSVELPRAAGKVSVRNLNLTAAEQVGWYEALGLLLISGWVAAALWGSRRLLAARKTASWRHPVLALLLALSLLQVVPQLGATRFAPLLPVGFVDFSGEVAATEPAGPSALSEPGDEPAIAELASDGGIRLRQAVAKVQFRLQRLDLLAHFVGFLLLTAACSWLAGARPMTVMPYLFAAALAGEIAQWSVQGQFSTADLIEILVDFAGVAALSLVLLASRIRQTA